MPAPPVPGGRPAPSNPFYSNNNPTSPPPNYGGSRPSAPIPTSEPVTYGSLKDLQRNQAGSKAPGYTYTAQPERAGYKAPAVELPSEGRRMPPPPGNYGMGVPPPPQRNATSPTTSSTTTAPPARAGAGAATATTGVSSYLPASAQGYANTAGTYASSAADRVREGFGNVATQERRDQVVGGVVKGAAGAAKLLGKGAWTLGKFAANGGKT